MRLSAEGPIELKLAYTPEAFTAPTVNVLSASPGVVMYCHELFPEFPAEVTQIIPLENAMAAVDSCQFGLWANGSSYHFLQKEDDAIGYDFEFTDLSDFPGEGESLADIDRADRDRPMIRCGQCRHSQAFGCFHMRAEFQARMPRHGVGHARQITLQNAKFQHQAGGVQIIQLHGQRAGGGRSGDRRAGRRHRAGRAAAGRGRRRRRTDGGRGLRRGRDRRHRAASGRSGDRAVRALTAPGAAVGAT